MVNAGHISAIDETTDREGDVYGSIIYFHEKSGFLVQESPDEILRMLSNA